MQQSDRTMLRRIIERLIQGRFSSWRWIVALLLFAATLLARIAFAPLFGELKILIFAPAVAAATLLCGWQFGGLVLILSALSAWYLFFEPINSLALNTPTAAALIGFIVVAGIIVILADVLREEFAQLEQARHVQEDLFRELQHRVANNFQVVVSLIQAARRNASDTNLVTKALTDAENRIMAMADTHRRFHEGTAYAEGLQPILREMLANAFRDLPVTVNIEFLGELRLSTHHATAITLLVNEAALNAAKHVFRVGKGTRFDVRLAKIDQAQVRLTIRDDGPGVVQNATRPGSLGMTIMRSFAKQLGGTLEMKAENGTVLSIVFPDL